MEHILNIHQLPNNYMVFGGGDIIDNPQYYKKHMVLVWQTNSPAVYHYGTGGQLVCMMGGVVKEEQLYSFDGYFTLTLIPLNLPESRRDYPSFVGQNKFKK